MTVLDKQSVLRLNRMLESLCREFKECHQVVVAGLGQDDDLEQEQLALDEHQNQVLDLIECISALAVRPTIGDSDVLPTNDRLIDRQFESMEESVRDVKRAVQTHRVGGRVLTHYLDKITSLEANLQGLQKEILSLDDNRKRKERASSIKNDLFDLIVTISHRLEESSKKGIQFPL